MPEIWDATIIFNELDMLETRFHILGDVVDHFVVCEAAETHSGQPKSYYLEQNMARFEPWADKIIYVKVDDLTGDGRNSWERERFHRSRIADGLTGARDDDWIIVADVDEIPHPLPVDLLRNFPPEVNAVKFELLMFYYDLNHRVDQGWAIGAARWGTQKNPNKIRTTEGAVIQDVAKLNKYHSGGWHFSYFGGAQQIIEKHAAFMHHADPGVRELPHDPLYISDQIAASVDLYGRDLKIERVPLTDTLPRYILGNLDKYRALGWVVE